MTFGGAALGQTRAPACNRPTLSCPEVARLLAGREGYGAAATGGLNGEFVLVTSPADSGPGTLRDALRSVTRPTWVRFARDMDIDLTREIPLPSNTTIDGRGRRVTLLEYGLEIQPGRQNIIATHLTIDGEFATKQVAFNIVGARDVWADHLDLSRFVDRLIDVKVGATNVTLSWIKFHDHNKVMLFNNQQSQDMFATWDRDSQSRVTLHHCWFVNTMQRNPRAIYGIYDIYNNLLENWDYYGMSFSLEARARVVGNIFVNDSRRPCTEPDHFDTIEGVTRNFCAGIQSAGQRSALQNGAADQKEYEQTRQVYGYTHDYRAFLAVAENLYLGSARAVLADWKPDRVPPMPYCTSYERPSLGLAAEIRRQAGNTPFEASPPPRCESK